MPNIDHLFIVGAGFSLHAGVPLTTDFTKHLLDTEQLPPTSPSNLIVRFLRRFVADTFDHKETAQAEFWPELEDIFTCIDLSANTGHHLGHKYAPSHLRTVRRALIVRTIRMLRQTYIKGKKHRTKALDSFFKKVHLTKSAFLSMNWDTVLEEGLAKRTTNVDYACNAFAASFEAKKIALLKPEGQPATILKPHGSTNWLYCDNCRNLLWFPADSTFRIAAHLFGERDWDLVSQSIDLVKTPSRKRFCPVCNSSALGTRFATFSYRKALDFPMYARTWLAAEKILRESKTWIFIGYSLPAADYEFKQLLKRVQLSRPFAPNLILITGGRGAQQTKKNYQKFFGPHFHSQKGTYFDKGLDETVMRRLKDIGALS